MSNRRETDRFIDVRIIGPDTLIDLDSLTKQLTTIDLLSGALVYFIGFVKGEINNAGVIELEYTVIDQPALEQLEKIAREEAERFNLSAVVIWHYTGVRRPGDITIVIATVARDRQTAFNAASEILERVKREAPIFKLERRTDGEYWVIGDGERYPRKRSDR